MSLATTSAPSSSATPGSPEPLSEEFVPEPPGKTSLLGWLASHLATVLVVTAAGAFFWFAAYGAGHGPSNEKEIHTVKQAPIAVTVAPVTTHQVRRHVSVVGTLHGREEFAIVPKVEGRLITLERDVGDVVYSGDVLGQIDPTDYQLAVDEARRALEVELSRLGRRELPTGTFDVKTLPAVARAAAQLTYTEARLKRVQELAGRNVSTMEEQQQAESQREIAAADYQQALLEAQTTLATARLRAASLQTAEQRLRETRIVVPGPTTSAERQVYVITQRLVSEGQMVYSMAGMSTTLFQLAMDQTLEMKGAVPERYRADVRAGQPVEVQVEAYPGRVFEGKVQRVSPSVDRASRTFEIEAVIPNNTRELAAGSFARGSILTVEADQAMTVPETAIVSFAGVTKVFVIRDDQSWDVPVRVHREVRIPGTDHAVWTEIEGDLKTGDQVVTSGQTRLSAGTPITVRGPEADSAQPEGE